MLVFLLLLSINISAQKEIKNVSNYQLTDLSRKILDMFIADSMNYKRIDSLRCSIVFSFEGKFNANNELWIFDDELLVSCINHNYAAKYKGFNIFISGSKILPKYIIEGKNILYKKNDCETLLNSMPKEFQVPTIYDGSMFIIKKGTTVKNVLIEKVQGG